MKVDYVSTEERLDLDVYQVNPIYLKLSLLVILLVGAICV
jgi:hypothetical protein